MRLSIDRRSQLADPYGWHTFERSLRGRPAVHAASGLCWQLQRTFTWNRVIGPEDTVTCRICLYHMGRYMPLSRLKEHQSYQRMRAEHNESQTMAP